QYRRCDLQADSCQGPATAAYHPNEAWGYDQAKAFACHANKSGLGADIVMHDRDSKFCAVFDAELRAAGLRVQKAAFRSQNSSLRRTLHLDNSARMPRSLRHIRGAALEPFMLRLR